MDKSPEINKYNFSVKLANDAKTKKNEIFIFDYLQFKR